MIHIIGNGWAWGPLAIAAFISVVATLFALRGKKKNSHVPRSFFFNGPAFSNAGAASTLLALLPLMISEEVRADPVSASLLAAASLLFSAATFTGFWLYSTINAQPVEANDMIVLKRPAWAAAQATVISLLIVGAGCFVAFVMFTNILGPSSVAADGGTILLECGDGGCKPHR